MAASTAVTESIYAFVRPRKDIRQVRRAANFTCTLLTPDAGTEEKRKSKDLDS
jgi:hypothetical protein